MIGHGFESGMVGFAMACGQMSADRRAQRQADREWAEMTRIEALAHARAVARIRSEFQKLIRENADLSSRLAAQIERACSAEREVIAMKKAALRRPS